MHIRTFAATFSLALGFFTTGDAQIVSTKDQIVEKSLVISPPHRRVDNDQKCTELDLGSSYLDYKAALDLYDITVAHPYDFSKSTHFVPQAIAECKKSDGTTYLASYESSESCTVTDIRIFNDDDDTSFEELTYLWGKSITDIPICLLECENIVEATQKLEDGMNCTVTTKPSSAYERPQGNDEEYRGGGTGVFVVSSFFIVTLIISLLLFCICPILLIYCLCCKNKERKETKEEEEVPV